MVPVGEGKPEESKAVMCETAEVVPMLFMNKASKTVKVKKGEEAGRALPPRTMKQIRLEKKGIKRQRV